MGKRFTSMPGQKRAKAQALQPDFERVKNAMKMVAKHKIKPPLELSEKMWDMFAESAVKMMWLIEEEQNSSDRSE